MSNRSGPVFNHAMIYVRDPGPAVHFYMDLLGFELIDEYPGVYARLRAPNGDGTIALHKLEPGASMPEGQGIRLYFEVEDLQGFCKRLEDAGVRFTQLPKMMPWGWEHAYLDDPDGYEISLYHAGAKRLQRGAP